MTWFLLILFGISLHGSTAQTISNMTIVNQSNGTERSNPTCTGTADDITRNSLEKKCIKFTKPQDYCEKELGNQWVYGNIKTTMALIASLKYYMMIIFLRYPDCWSFFAGFLCNHFLPKCGFVNNTIQLQIPCYDTCIALNRDYCPRMESTMSRIKNTRDLDVIHLDKKIQDKLYQIVNCSYFPERNKLTPSECYYPRILTERKDTEKTSVDCYSVIGYKYGGNITKTINNRACQYWTKRCPHFHTWNTSEDMQDLQLHNNSCRNPSGYRDRPWCYTSDVDVRWEYCNVKRCPNPVNGNYTEWSVFTPCLSACGPEYQFRNRSCSNPKPAFGGRNCSHLGRDTEQISCNHTHCQENTYWRVSACSVTCGTGTQKRERQSNRGPIMEYISCNLRACPLRGLNEEEIWLTVASIFVFAVLSVLSVTAARRYGCPAVSLKKNRKSSLIDHYSSVDLTDPRNIAYLQRLDDLDVAETIYSAFIDNEPCVCYNCMENWLQKIYVNIGNETREQEKPLVLIRDLQRFQDVYENCSVENGNRRPPLSPKCLKEWFCSCVSYSKLQFADDATKDWKTEDLVIRLVYGAFDELGNPLYDKLARLDKRNAAEEV